MKRVSEAELGVALRAMDFDPAPYVYRLPDPKTGVGVSNWKPADFLVWWRMSLSNWPGRPIIGVAWVEAKDVTTVGMFPRADLRPSQVAGIREARRLGIPYLLAIYWRKARRWTISNAVAVLDWLDEHEAAGIGQSIPRSLLMSRFGVDAEPANLSQTIRVILEDGW